MTIKIRPAEPSDGTKIAKVHYEALATYHPFYAAFFETHPREILPAATLASLQDSENRFVVAADDEEVVGFIRYNVIDGAEKTEDEGKEDRGGSMPKDLFNTKDYMKDLWAEFNAGNDEKDKISKEFESQPHICPHPSLLPPLQLTASDIKHLMVLPTHQYRGIGATLLRTVVEESDARQLTTILVSSAEGEKLYHRFWFKEKMTWRIDNGAWSEKIVEKIRDIGVEDTDGLVERYKGVDEVEMYMVRLPARW
ncbi:Fc.00g075400.m01.CDS01 [Cosmosporella sp. VM-42]